MILEQPIALNADLTDSSLKGSWLSPVTKGSAKDASSAGDDMTAVGGVEFQKDGAEFNGITGYLRRAEADWRSADSVGTIEAWIYRDVSGANHVIFSSSDEAGPNKHIEFYVSSTNLLTIANNNASGADSVEGSTVINANEYYHVVVISNGSSYLMYVNNNPETLNVVSGSNNGDWMADTEDRDNIIIGALKRNSTSAYFNGEIKIVNYYSSAKSASWVSERFHRGVPDSSLVLAVDGDGLDKSRYRHTITNSGVIVGKRMEFDGASSLAIPAGILSSSSGTIVYWAKTNTIAAGNAYIYIHRDPQRIYMYRNGANFYIALGSTFVDSTFDFIVDKWVRVGMTWDGTNYKTFMNGVPGAASTYTGLAAPPLVSYIGAAEGVADFWNGGLDEGLYFNTAKSDSWFKIDYEQSKGRY